MTRGFSTSMPRDSGNPSPSVPGSMTYQDGDQIRVVTLSLESELLLRAYLGR